MADFYERIRALCKDKGVTVHELESQLGLSRGYILNTGKRGSVPSSDRLDRIASYLGVSREFLMGQAERTSSVSHGVLIPLLGRVAAGVPISEAENIIGQEEITKAMAAQGPHFALRVKGNSMEPYIMDGDIVIVRQQETADSGDIVVALVGEWEEACVKRLRMTEFGALLISINPAYEPMVFSARDEIFIVGKVVEIRRKL